MIETKLIENSFRNESEKPYKMEIVWKNVIAFIIMHFMAFRVLWFFRWDGFFFHFAYAWITAFGIVAGAHRLYAHRSYKANFKLQVLLVLFQAICMENDMIEWVRDHRVHHKYSETNADPHNSKRGFFFSHMGWLMCKKHPDVKKYGKRVYMDDIESDPLLQFQRTYYFPIIFTFAFLLPILFTMYVLNECFIVSLYACFARYVFQLHFVWLINSVAHMGSWKPYDKNIAASDSRVNGNLTLGEGWHNFHHTFPFDYKVSELPLYRHNAGLAFIDFFAWIGWATELKVASDDMVRKRVLRTGDGSHPYAKMKKFEDDLNNNNNNNSNNYKEESVYWGLGDNDITDEDMRDIKTLKKA